MIVISVMFIVFTLGQILFKRPYVTFLFSCHQNPERSLKYLGEYLGICARCTGILIGIFIMPFITIINFNYLYLLLGLIPLIADGSFQQFTKYKSNNLKRIITGILFGFGMIVFISYYYLVIAKIIIYFI